MARKVTHEEFPAIVKELKGYAKHFENFTVDDIPQYLDPCSGFPIELSEQDRIELYNMMQEDNKNE